MKYFALGFAALFAYRLISNISALARICYYDKKYTLYLSSSAINFKEYNSAVVQLFKKASLPDLQIPYVQPIGFGQLIQGNTSFFGNLDNRREDVVGGMLKYLAEAKGTFKHRIIENFSPLFWIDCVLFLPRTVLEYMGVDGNGVITKVFQLLYWVAAPLLLVFRDKLSQYILSLIG